MSKKPSSDKDGVQGAAGAVQRRAEAAQPSTREQQIAHLAYEKAEARGFVPGHEMDDWLEAEAEIDGDYAPHLHAARPAARAADLRR